MKAIVNVLNRSLHDVSALLGMAVFITAILLWNPEFSSEHAPLSFDETQHGLFLAIAQSNHSVVAVGEHGRIFSSVDRGKTWQACLSPFDLTLTDIFFLNDQLGWAVGYDGVILKSIDAGATWFSVRNPSQREPPIFAVWFEDEKHGIAVGAQSLVYRTTDGGTHWTSIKLEMQAHMYAVAQTDDGLLWIAGENQALYQSSDHGATWQKMNAPFSSSVFGMLALPEHQLLTFGLRGRVSLWTRSGLTVSQKIIDENIFSGIRMQDGRIVLVGQRGHILIRHGRNEPFQKTVVPPEKDISAVIEVADALIFVGEFGIQRIRKEELGL